MQGLGASGRLQMKGEKERGKMVMKRREETRGPCGDSDAYRDLFFAVRPRWPPRPQLPVEKMCQRMLWVSHGKRPCLSR
ncbi:hypothetical protein VZT92_013421 [Zoarces viviparus]|uniref:Uncharacterized protein n=1 Tax=Zoarces viviparus TaxID=48416 RepID=A0AAW1F3R4_ZOAVI